MKKSRTIKELQNVAFKDMSRDEFEKMKRNAMDKPFSKIGQFYNDLKNYHFEDENGNRVLKWEIWNAGYRIAERLINNKTKYKSMKHELS